MMDRALTLTEYLALLSEASPIQAKDDVIVDECRGKVVLDVGCIDHSLERVSSLGDKWLHGRIARVAREVVGVDILESEAAQLCHSGYSIVTADAQTMDLGRRFDRVVLGDILEHVENPGDLLRAARRHLNPGGRIIMSTPNPFYVGRMMTALRSNTVSVNSQHVAWFDPVVVFHLVERVDLRVIDFRWVKVRHAGLENIAGWKGLLARRIARFVTARRSVCRSDFLLLIGEGIDATDGSDGNPGQDTQTPGQRDAS